MKSFAYSLSTARSLTVLLMLLVFSCGTQAAAILTLSGKAEDVKYEDDAKLRVSVIDWSAPEQLASIEAAYRQYQDDRDLETFLDIVDQQDTRGYLFTAAATGYRIKYAWKEDREDNQVMHFLVTPGLKTRNPYLWETPNNNSPAFTLVQVQFSNKTGIAKTSLDGEIVFNELGKLQLQSFESLPKFATLEDSTPYYLKQDH